MIAVFMIHDKKKRPPQKGRERGFRDSSVFGCLFGKTGFRFSADALAKDWLTMKTAFGWF
ncbi:hypothetical protein H4S14_003942 [Agrobacterium vitis]|nr:hypothetical protein [Agrobacterium vitis]MBE1440171.1 hypothetical protein [Agrobacterium vitis]